MPPSVQIAVKFTRPKANRSSLELTTVQLSRDTIISAALDLLDTYGLADTTMRRIAAALGVAPGALYWHVANKQALLAAMTDEILAPVCGDSPRELALSLHAALLAHRDGAEVATAALSQPDSKAWPHLVARVEGSLADTGAPAPARRIGALSILHLVLGATVMEQSRLQLAQATGAISDAAFEDDAADAAARQSAETIAQSTEIVVAGLPTATAEP